MLYRVKSGPEGTTGQPFPAPPPPKWPFTEYSTGRYYSSYLTGLLKDQRSPRLGTHRHTRAIHTYHRGDFYIGMFSGIQQWKGHTHISNIGLIISLYTKKIKDIFSLTHLHGHKIPPIMWVFLTVLPQWSPEGQKMGAIEERIREWERCLEPDRVGFQERSHLSCQALSFLLRKVNPRR